MKTLIKIYGFICVEQKFKPRKAFAYELGIAIRTFERKIKGS